MSITRQSGWILNGEYSRDAAGNLTTTRTYRYLFTAGESPVQVAQQSDILENGATHPDNDKMKVRNLQIVQVDGDPKKGSYDAIYTYTLNKQTDVNDETIAPWKRNPYNISITPLEQVVAFQKAYQDGDSLGNPTKPVLNPAGDPYEDTTVEQNTIVRFTYNLKDFNPEWIDKYTDTVNKDATTVIDLKLTAKKWRIKNLSTSYQIEYDAEGEALYKYWSVDTELEGSKKIWQKEILARGLYFKETIDGTPTKFRIYTDDAGLYGKKSDMGTGAIPVDEPQLLNSDGSLYTSGDVYYDTFYDKFFIAWTPLNFPKKRFLT